MPSERITDSLEAAIEDPSLQDSMAALGEVVLDASMESGALRDIPILGSLIGLGRAAFAIRDRLFLNKLRHFLLEVEDVPHVIRQEMIDSINSSPESEIHVGEKVLYIVDRCEDHRKAALAGRLFKRMLEGLLDYADFLTLSGVLDRCSPAEILEFAGEAWDTISLEELPSYLLGTPLVKVWQEQLSVRDQEDWKRSERYVAEGGGVVAEISRLGRELREAFKPSANSQR